MIHFALIGLGGMGSRWAGVISKVASLDAVVDSSIKGLPTLEDVLSDPYINAVLIAVPHKYLAGITKEALKAGKHVLCEKPGAIYSKEIQKNFELAEKNKLKYMIGYNYHFHDGYIKARKMFNEGKIGNLIFIRAIHGFGGRPGYEKEWRINKDIGGGGHLHDQGTHLINMVLSYLLPNKIEGFITDSYWETGTEDNAFVIFKEEDMMASIHSSLTQWDRKHTFELYGTKGYLRIEGLGMRYGEPEKLIYGKRVKGSEKTVEKIIKCDPVADHSLEKELKEFISGIKNKEFISGMFQAKRTLEVIEKIYRKDSI